MDIFHSEDKTSKQENYCFLDLIYHNILPQQASLDFVTVRQDSFTEEQRTSTKEIKIVLLLFKQLTKSFEFHCPLNKNHAYPYIDHLHL